MKYDADDPRITAYLFDELEPDERAELENELHRKPELRELIEQTRSTVDMLRAEFVTREKLSLNDEQRAVIQTALSSESREVEVSQTIVSPQKVRPRRSMLLRIATLSAVGASILFLVSFFTPVPHQTAQRAELQSTVIESLNQAEKQTVPFPAEAPLVYPDNSVWDELQVHRKQYNIVEFPNEAMQEQPGDAGKVNIKTLTNEGVLELPVSETASANDRKTSESREAQFQFFGGDRGPREEVGGEGSIQGIEGTTSLVVGNTPEDLDRSANVAPLEREIAALEDSNPAPVQVDFVDGLDAIVRGERVLTTINEREHSGGEVRYRRLPPEVADGRGIVKDRFYERLEEAIPDRPDHGIGPGNGGDKFDLIVENDFLRVTDAPLSTFSIDVDTASYSKVRMFLNEHHQLPRPDAVRIEELINYFSYNYAPPTSDDPFAAHLAVTACPWNSKHKLVRIGIKGKEIQKDNRPKTNLVFLLDVSGSMNEPNKLPLLKRGMKMLADQLSENDRVAIVVYAGAAGMVLDSTTGDRKSTIAAALDRLNAGGSTNGGEGIQLAYQTALDHFIKGGVNRVILCTDGDFNVGTTGTDELVRLVEQHAKSGVFLSVLGFGMGNHNDAMLEQISNKGNGNYAFVDTDREAKKVLVEQMSATLVTIAKDVKIQVEFNPAKVSVYRLIGYENRVLAAQDFNDDTKDAGEIGAGHTVTALYEVVPTGQGASVSIPPVDELKYQAPKKSTQAADADELLTLKLRYKQPDGDTSKLLTFPLTDSDQTFNNADRDFQFASAVASYGMLLRDSKYKGNATYSAVLEIATPVAQNDETGYRAEFLDLVRAAAILAGQPKD